MTLLFLLQMFKTFALICAEMVWWDHGRPVPTCRRNPIGRIIFFYLVLYKEKAVCFNMNWATWGSLALPRPISRIIPIGGAVQSNSFASRFY